MKKKLNCVLLIDDDEATNFINKMLLEEAGCAEHIQVACSGQMALNYLTSSGSFAGENKNFPCPDLIFLDVNMPAMNGWEFLQRYHELEKHHKGNIVMVMLTTSLNPDDRVKADEIPEISGFESKPLSGDKLIRVLKKYFAANF